MLEKQLQELSHQLDDDQRQYEAALNDRDAQLRRMREECQTLVAELQALLDTKQILDAEIAIYRKMLESEENRQGLRSMVEQVVKSHSLQQQEDTESQRTVRGEMSTRTTFQRSAKGNMTIAECDPDGKFIVVENQSRSKARRQLGRPHVQIRFGFRRRTWASGSCGASWTGGASTSSPSRPTRSSSPAGRARCASTHSCSRCSRIRTHTGVGPRPRRFQQPAL